MLDMTTQNKTSTSSNHNLNTSVEAISHYEEYNLLIASNKKLSDHVWPKNIRSQHTLF